MSTRRYVCMIALLLQSLPLAVLARAQSTPPAIASLTYDNKTKTGTWDQAQVLDSGKVCLKRSATSVDPAVQTIELVSDANQDLQHATPLGTHLPGSTWTPAQWAASDLCVALPVTGKYYGFATDSKGSVTLLGPGIQAVAALSAGSTTTTGMSTSTATTSTTNNQAPPPSDAAVAAVMQEAQKHIKHNAVDRNVWGVVGGEVTLYFLPNGEPVDPLPNDLTERDRIHLKILLPTADLGSAKSPVAYQLTACPTRDATRIEGDWASVKQVVGMFQGAMAFSEKEIDVLDCGAGTVSFVISTKYGQKVSALTLAPVYFGTFGVQFAFDATQNGSLGTGTDSAGKTVVVRNTDLLGPGVLPVFTLHPFGGSFEHPTVAGVLFNPMLGVDLNNLTTSFYVSDSICAWALCLGAGAHIRQVDELTAASGLHVGDAFDATKGTLPTEKRWQASDGGVGFFFGLTLDVNTTLKLVGGKNGSGGSSGSSSGGSSSSTSGSGSGSSGGSGGSNPPGGNNGGGG